jgi:hypothetical protein
VMCCLPSVRREELFPNSFGDKESNIMVRLRDGHDKLSATRHGHYAGSQRQMVNQMRTGTASRLTLLNVLEKRSEHL